MAMGNVHKVEFGTYTPSEDVFASQTQITHSLRVIPNFIIVVADEIVASTDLAVHYISNAYCAISNLVASNKISTGFAAYEGNYQSRDTVQQALEQTDYTKFLNANTFKVPYYSTSDMLKAGVTYHYIIGVIE